MIKKWTFNAFLRLKAILYSYFWVAPSIGILAFCWFFRDDIRKFELGAAATALGGVFGFSYFIQKQKLDETNFFRRAFIEFNDKYEAIGPSLASILKTKSVHSAQRAKLIEYFNLCGEEYLLYKRGYIPTDVWASWVAGMRQYWHIPAVRDIWIKEINTESYYGFDPNLELSSKVGLANEP